MLSESGSHAFGQFNGCLGGGGPEAWTLAEVNALRAGLESGVITTSLRVTQLTVTVDVGDALAYAYGLMTELLSYSGREAATFAYTVNGELKTRTQAGVTWT